MTQKYLYIISALSVFLFASCNEWDDEPYEDTSKAVELTGIRAVIASGEEATTRADENTTVLSDHVGRYRDFENGDKLVFTSIRRTASPINVFNYSDIEYNVGEESSLQRDKNTGSTVSSPDTHPDKIYWSDAKSGHTFIGYSAPNVTGFDWREYGQTNVFYGSLGDPTNQGYIDYDDTQDGNLRITNDDILLTWDDRQVADNAVAFIKFYHGLALIRVQVSLTGFASDNEKDDKHAVASKMIFKQMPTLYKWNQVSHNTEALTEGDQEAVTATYSPNTVEWNQKKDVHFWCPRPDGDDVATMNNKFTFYALAVPQPDVDGQQVEFTVTYPNPMKPNENLPHTYKATLPNDIVFRAGYCTTININLNHQNEKITIGAEYIDWQFAATPDDGSLKKNSTFLSSVDLSKVTTADQDGITIDNATWLFQGESTMIYDIYQNIGTAEKPYQIRTAAQLLSFAKEVNNGRTFEGQYISLDAGLYLQKSTSDTGMLWPGIGTAEHPFQGTFIGGMRRISRLQGDALFGCIGEHGHVGQILLEDVISIKDSRGALADSNKGIIDGCKVESRADKILVVHTNGTVDFAGALCGENSGMIIACYATGSFCGNADVVGGLVGKNTGSVVASYTALQLSTVSQLTVEDKTLVGNDPVDPTSTVGGVVGEGSCQYCFYCNEMTTSTRTGEPATGMTVNAMQKFAFVGSTEATNVETSQLNGAIHHWCSEEDKSNWPAAFQSSFDTLAPHFNQIKFIDRVAAFPYFDDTSKIQ